MKKIINNKVYDTDTAVLIGNWNNDRHGFDYCSEYLFRKRTGEYFIHGVSGAMGRYAVSAGQNSWTGGEKIIPLDYDHARSWAEKNLTAKEYEAEFGEVTEDETTTIITLSMPLKIVETARRKAQETGKSLSAYISSLIVSDKISDKAE